IVQQYMSDKQAEQYASVKTDGAAFLKENAQRAGVTTTASGLQYEVLAPGSGAKPTPADKVTVHYHGTIIDGTVFDSSVQRNSPATFGVTQVIQGWVEGLQLMSMGAKYKFFIPYDLAYGERGAGPKIPPFSTLIFEVELLKIN
ncbi:MAG: FKBP-type peptidyl-prolyl cis-trans isomerase, partial [Saprospiraceae bacterium]